MTVDQLIKSGKLTIGTELIWTRRGLKTTYKAKILAGGKIQTSDGQIHKTPSGAAKHLNGNKPVDGWLAWKIEETGLPLGKLR
jgi:hypothetical protein